MILPFNGHVKAIFQLVEPASVDELIYFLGLVSYISRFIDRSSEVARPLYVVLERTVFSKKRSQGKILFIHEWVARWGSQQKECREKLKECLSNHQTLAAPKQLAPKKLIFDASAYGLCKVPLQQNEDGLWDLVLFTSRQLRKTELTYAVLDKRSVLRWSTHSESGGIICTEKNLKS